MFECC